MTAGKHVLRPYGYYFVSYNDLCFAALLVLLSVNEAILARAKSSNGTTVRTFSNLIFCVVIAHPFPFLLLLRHYALLTRRNYCTCDK